MTNESKFTIKIEGPGVSIDREVEPEVVQQIIMLVLTGQTGSAPVGQMSKPAAQPQGGTAVKGQGVATPQHTPPMAIRGFLNQHAPKRSPDKITAIAEFLRAHNKQKTFSRDDLVRMFEESAEPVPRNLARDIKWTVKTGWIAPKSGEKGSYYITSDGIEAVSKNFPKELVKKTTITPQGRRGKKKTSNGDE